MRKARPTVTGGTLGAHSSLRRSRAKLAAKNPADRSLQGTLSLRAQRGAVTRGANRLGKVRAASTVRMTGKGPAGVIRKGGAVSQLRGRVTTAKPVAAAPKNYKRGRSAAAGYKPKTDRTLASSQVGTRATLSEFQRAEAQTAKQRFGVRSTAQNARMRAGSYDPAKQGGGRVTFRTRAEAGKAYLNRAAATKSTASKSYNGGRYAGDGVKTGTKGSARIRTAAVAQGNLLSGKADNVRVRKARSFSDRSALGGAMRRAAGTVVARKGKPVAPKSIASQKADLEKIIYNGSNSLEVRKAARDKIFKLDPSYSLEPGRQKFPPKQLSAAEKAANAKAAASEQRRKDFMASMPPMQRAKANAALEKYTVNNGNGVFRQALIEDFVKKGYRVQVQNGRRRLVGPDGAYFEQSALTKTGLDFADYLAKSAPTPRKPSPKGAGPRMKAARPAGTVAKPKGLKVGAIAGRKGAGRQGQKQRAEARAIANYNRSIKAQPETKKQAGRAAIGQVTATRAVEFLRGVKRIGPQRGMTSSVLPKGFVPQSRPGIPAPTAQPRPDRKPSGENQKPKRKTAAQKPTRSPSRLPQETRSALRDIASRRVQAEQALTGQIQKLGGITKQQAQAVFNYYSKRKFIKSQGIDGVGVKSGNLLDKDTIRQALQLAQEPAQPRKPRKPKP
jgi:hypothetical protein